MQQRKKREPAAWQIETAHRLVFWPHMVALSGVFGQLEDNHTEHHAVSLYTLHKQLVLS